MASKRWSLEGKRALVTGGTKGIGFSISQELLALGGEVFIVARNAPQLENCIDSWREKGFGVSGMRRTFQARLNGSRSLRISRTAGAPWIF